MFTVDEELAVDHKVRLEDDVAPRRQRRLGQRPQQRLAEDAVGQNDDQQEAEEVHHGADHFGHHGDERAQELEHGEDAQHAHVPIGDGHTVQHPAHVHVTRLQSCFFCFAKIQISWG